MLEYFSFSLDCLFCDILCFCGYFWSPQVVRHISFDFYCLSMYINSGGVNQRFHHDTIFYWFFGQLCVICSYDKVCHDTISIRYRGLPYEILHAHLTQSVTFILTLKKILNYAFNWKTIYFFIQIKRCLERSCAWMETVTWTCHGTFKIKAYFNDGDNMIRCFLIASMLLDGWS